MGKGSEVRKCLIISRKRKKVGDLGAQKVRGMLRLGGKASSKTIQRP